MIGQNEPRRILITGANGFVGRYLIRHLLADRKQKLSAGEAANEIEIFAAVHPEHLGETVWPGGESAGWGPQQGGEEVHLVPLEVCDPAGTSALLERVRPDHVYHLAARASGADADREAVFAVNVTGTRNLLEAAAALTPYPRVLLASTSYVYGNTDPERPAREEDPIGPLWRYGAYADSKIEMETVARAYRGLAIIGRAFAHTGPGQAPTFAIPAFARQLARIEVGLEPPELHVGNLQARRDLLDVRDVVGAYHLLMSRAEPGEVYNIATGQPLAMRAILDRLRALCKVPTEVKIDPARLRPVDIACSTGDASKLRAWIGWQPRFSLDETLRATLDYWREQVGIRD